MLAAWRGRGRWPRRIGAPLAIVDKRREKPGASEVMNIIGDVKGRSCILVDDIADSGGTLINAAKALLERGRQRGQGLYYPWRFVRIGCFQNCQLDN